MTPATFRFDDDGGIPNSPLPVLIYHGVEAANDADACEDALHAIVWLRVRRGHGLTVRASDRAAIRAGPAF